MKRVLLIIIIISFGLCSIKLFSKEKNLIEIDGIKYAIQVNGTSTNTFPSGNYKVDVTCQNATGYWDNITRKIIVNNITGSVTCDIVFNSITSNDYLNTYIIGLNNTLQGSGKVVLENGYRYEGKNPNNYIWFNNELWRIIGVFDSSRHGVANKNLVKIVRDKSIQDLSMSNENSNNWVTSKVNAFLNNAYYNATVDNQNCYVGSMLVKCDFTATGLQSGYREMVQNVTWYLGGYGKSGCNVDLPDTIFDYEDNSNCVYGSNPYSTTGKVGLIYTSDYVYSALAEDCSRNIVTKNIQTNECTSNNWMFEWNVVNTMNQASNYNNYYYVPYYGRSSVQNSSSPSSIKPVLYLNSNVYRVSGSGSLTDPYIIGM